MPACLFLTFNGISTAQPFDMSKGFAPIADAMLKANGFAGLRAHVPSNADDPYLQDTDAPELVLQVYFSAVDELEAQVRRGSVLHAVLDDARATHALSGRLDSPATWQAMSVEPIELEATRALPEVHCTYLVAYEGASPDEATWHAHYFEHHVPLMKRLPGLRQLEIYRPLAVGLKAPALARFEPTRAMQRNKVVFDSSQALTAALNSPIRHEMRKDYEQSPPFTGRSTHYPMATFSWPEPAA
ncbi:MAG: hypothetical protein JWQ11_4804 [Rhizobacter sp.]|nr:hypothetical protein [Rhizobacter sp.]